VLLIADSNMRSVKLLPAQWEAHIFPGARFGHIMNVLKRSLSQKRDGLECVYIQVGVNHLDDREVPMRQMNSIVDVIHYGEAQAVFVSVSYAYDLPGKQRMHIDAINNGAQQGYWSETVYRLVSRRLCHALA